METVDAGVETTQTENQDTGEVTEQPVVTEQEQQEQVVQQEQQSGEDVTEEKVEDTPEKPLAAKRGRPPKQKWTDETVISYNDDVPELYRLGEETLKGAVEKLKEAGYTPKQAQEIVELNAAFTEAQDKALTEQELTQIKATEETLRNEFGSDYDTNLNQAADFVNKYFDEETADLLLNSSLLNTPAAIKSVLNLAKDYVEKPAFRGQTATVTTKYPNAHQELLNIRNYQGFNNYEELSKARTNPADPLYKQANAAWESIVSKYR